MFLFVILTSQLMVVLDTTIVNVALPHMQKGLGLSGGSLSWVLNAYLLTLVACFSWAPDQAIYWVGVGRFWPWEPL